MPGPPMHRRPSPYGAAVTRVWPWITTLKAVLSSPVVVRTTVSAGVVVPLATRCAPRVAAELSQPLPVAPLFAHGQGAERPSPAHRLVPSSGWQTGLTVRNPSTPASTIEGVPPSFAVKRTRIVDVKV